MLQSAVLDVAMGVVFVFLLVSLLVSAATEMFASLLKWRAVNLWQGIARLMQSEDARTRLYQHPLIKGIAARAPNETDWRNGRSGPSYIPSRTFAMALIDLLREPREVAARVHQEFEQTIAGAKTNPATLFDAVHDAITRLSPELPPKLKDDLMALQRRTLSPADAAVVKTAKADLQKVQSMLPPAAAERLQKWLDAPQVPGDTYAAMRAELAAIVAMIPAGDVTAVAARPVFRDAIARTAEGDPNAAIAEINAFLAGRLKRWTDYATGGLEGLAGALSPLLDEAAGDIDRFRDEIETWFNSGMDRVSGWYKRHTQAWQFGIAFALAVALNIDTLLLVSSLWQDPALRQAIASQASQVVANPSPSLKVPPATTQDATGQLNVELSQPTVDAGDTVTAYIDLRTADANRDVDVTTASGHLKIMDAKNQPQPMITIAVPAGRKASVTLQADSVTSESLEQFQVSRMGQAVQTALVVRPSSTERFAEIKNQLGETNLPIGWRSCAPTTAQSQRLFWCDPPSFNQTWILGVLAMLLGWLLTSAAASLGAPFWFDTLSRVASIRSAGKPPEPPKKDDATG